MPADGTITKQLERGVQSFSALAFVADTVPERCGRSQVAVRDGNTRAQFINRAFRGYFSLPDEKADSRPPFVALMYHGRATRAYELPEDALNAYVARRMEMVRAGDSTPIDIKLADGNVLRFSCTALPDGGRMLSYTPVTDLIRSGDAFAAADDFHALRSGQFGPVYHLRAAE